MIHVKLISVCCMLCMLAVQVHSTPIALAQITSNLPAAEASFAFVGTGNALKTDMLSDSYIRLEIGGADPQESFLTGNGTVSNDISGASAIAESNDASTLNRAQTSIPQGAANSTSMTTTRFYYDVENVNSVALSFDMNTSVQLLTEAPDESAYASVDATLGLYWFDVNHYALLDEQHFFFDQEVFDGAGYAGTDSPTLNLSYSFENAQFNGLFTGQLLIEGITMTWADNQAPVPVGVPEPQTFSLIVLGMGMLFCFKKQIRMNK